MKKRIGIIWCLTALYGFGQQQVTIEEMANPAGGAISRLKTARDGRLWVFTTPGTLLAQTAATPTAPLQKVGEFPLGSFDNSGFYPGVGDSTILSAGRQKKLDLQASVSPAGVQSLCGDYIATGGKTLLPNSLGSFPSSDGNRYVVNTDGVSSTINLRGKANGGLCNLSSVASVVNAPFLQVWKQVDGNFLTQVKLGVADNTGSHTEVAIAHSDGTLSRLVSTSPANRSSILAGVCCDLVADWSRDQSLVTHMGTNGDGGHAFLYKNGVVIPVYANDGEGLVNDRIWGYDLNGDWVVIGGLSQNAPPYEGYRLLLINIATRQRWVIVQTGKGLLGSMGNFIPLSPTVGPDGTVYFSVSNSGKIFRATILGVTGIVLAPSITSFTVDNPAIVTGGSAKISWVTVDAQTCAIDQGVGTVPCTGTFTVSPTVTTPYTLTATGPGGITSSLPLTVTVTPKPALPTFEVAGVVNAASYKPPPSAGSIASVYGSNLASGTLVATTVTLPTSLLGTQVLINGVAVPLFSVSPGQINFQVPWETPSTSATMRIVSTLGASVMATIPLSTTPGLFTGIDGNVIAQNSNWEVVTTANPAKTGDVVVLYGTGLGPATYQPKTGEPTPAVECRTLAIPDVFIGGQKATVLYSGLAPGMIGVYQLNIIVPPPAMPAPPAMSTKVSSLAAMSTSTVPVVVDLNGQKSDESAQIAIAQ